jgi:transposase
MVKKDNEQGLIGRYSAKGNYDQRFIKQIVEEVEKGLTIKAASIQYGLKVCTISSWMSKYGSASYKETHKQFSPTIKRSVVRAVTEGGLSIKEAQTAYGIKEKRTIINWLEHVKRENDELVASNTSVVDTKKSTDSSAKDLQADNEVLKKQLQEAQLKIAALNTLIDVAEEQLKINIRKKPGAKQS